MLLVALAEQPKSVEGNDYGGSHVGGNIEPENDEAEGESMLKTPFVRVETTCTG